jgi:hypothetical protein
MCCGPSCSTPMERQCPRCGDETKVKREGERVWRVCSNGNCPWEERLCPKCGSEMEKDFYMEDAVWWCDTCRAYYPRHEEKLRP